MKKILLYSICFVLTSCVDSKPDPIFVKKIFEYVRNNEFGYTIDRNSFEVKKVNEMTYEATYIIYINETEPLRRTGNYYFSYGDWNVKEDLHIEDAEWILVEEKISGLGWVDIREVEQASKQKIENMEDNNICSTVLRKIMDYDERYYFEGINIKASNLLINLEDYSVVMNVPEKLHELNEFESTVEKNMDGINKIHPIGWSKNGLFAYIEAGNSDMVGGFNRLKVTSMVSDKNIISFTGGDEMVGLSTKEWWCLNYNEISSLLNQYDISHEGMVLGMNDEYGVIKYLSYKDISDTDNSSIYSITTKSSNCSKSNNVAVCYGQTCDVKVIVTNNNTGKEKSIFKKNSFCGSKLTFVSAIKNPIEDRIAILVEYEKRGFEGVYTRDVINIGCKLF